jgi:hypothetical protein
MSCGKPYKAANSEIGGIYPSGRRDALRNIALLMGSALSASTLSALFDSCSTPSVKTGDLFTADQQEHVTAIADIIIPDTDTPGAKAAGVGLFITMMLEECYPKNIQELFLKGLEGTDLLARKTFNVPFIKLDAQQKHTVFKQIADDTIARKKADREKRVVYFFQLIRELTLLGYFTSEIGTTQALVYIPIPGKYDGNIPLLPGQKAWAL